MKTKHLLKKLYVEGINTLKDKGNLKWILSGIAIYGAPAIYRAVTRNNVVPIFPFIDTGTKFVPSNLYEKLVVNFFAPGGVGAVLDNKYAEKLYGKLYGIKKYLSAVSGSLALTTMWTTLQYMGYAISDKMHYTWPSDGNPFEGPEVYPFNIFLAVTVAPLLPYVSEYMGAKSINV